MKNAMPEGRQSQAPGLIFSNAIQLQASFISVPLSGTGV